MVGWVLWSTENKKDSTAQVGAKKELNVYIYIYIIINIINNINIINITNIIM